MTIELKERTLQPKLRYWASVDRAGAGTAPSSLLDEAAAQLDALTAERDELKRALGFARESYGGAASEAFDAIAILCGCEQWDYPGQLVRDVERLRAERDQARVALVQQADLPRALEAQLATALQQWKGLDEHTSTRIRELENAVNVLADERDTALQQCANVVPLLAKCERFLGGTREANGYLADSKELLAELRDALATDATASPQPHICNSALSDYIDCPACREDIRRREVSHALAEARASVALDTETRVCEPERVGLEDEEAAYWNKDHRCSLPLRVVETCGCVTWCIHDADGKPFAQTTWKEAADFIVERCNETVDNATSVAGIKPDP